MAISHVGTNHATASNGTSVTVTKPAGTTQNDILLGFFTSNNQNCTPPSGWTEIADQIIEVFRGQVFYKVAGTSEPTSYTFSVGAAAPLVGTVTALRGIDSSTPIDITASSEATLTETEPYTTPGITGGTAGRLLYFRTVRISGTTPATFTAASVTELKDVGVFSGGTVCYSQGLYLANSDYSGGGTKSGLAITCNSSETHNFGFTVGIKSEAGLTGTFDVTVPKIPAVSIAAEWAYAATLNVNPLPMPTMSVDAFSGNFEGPLDVTVTPTVSIAGNTDVRGTLGVVAGPTVDISGETRFFGSNAVTPEREERWFVMTQDGYYIGVRAIVDVPMRITLPLPVVSITVVTAAQGPHVPVEVATPDPTAVINAFPTAITTATATANNATVLTGRLAFAELVEADTFTAMEDPSVGIVFTAETVVAKGEAFNLIGASVLVPGNTATVTAFNATAGNAKNAPAEHVAVSVVANAPQSGVANAFAGHASVSAAANGPTVKITLTGGHAAVNCHN